MATLPSQDTFSAGEKVTAVKLNKNIKDSVNFLLDPPSASVTSPTSTAYGDNATTVVNFNTELWDNDNMFSSGTPSRLTIVTPGLYLISVSATWASNSTGSRVTLIRKNGGELARINVPGAGTTGAAIAAQERFAAGDYIDIQVVQSSGGSLAPSLPIRLTATWRGI